MSHHVPGSVKDLTKALKWAINEHNCTPKCVACQMCKDLLILFKALRPELDTVDDK